MRFSSLFRRRAGAIMLLGIITSVTPISAQACQLMCFITSAKYDGSQVGGLAGGDAKCAAEYAGFKMVRNASLATINLTTNSGTGGYGGGIYYEIAGNGGVWVGDSVLAHNNNYSCSNFTSTSGNGPIIRNASSSNALVGTSDVCSTSRPIMCCNM